MSKKDKEVVETKYDQKVKAKEAEKKSDAVLMRLLTILAIVLVVVVVIVIALIPINKVREKKAYEQAGKAVSLIIDGEEVLKPEYDYNFNVVKANYIASYGAYMEYMGVDLSGDLSAIKYSEDMSFEDYFLSEAAESIKVQKAVYKEALSNNFEHETAAEVAVLISSVEEAAAAEGTAFEDFIKANYGQYITKDLLSEYASKTFYVAAYYDEMGLQCLPTDAEVEAVYKESPADYDSVDYKYICVSANIESEEPTDEEIAVAMAAVEEQAQAKKGDVDSEGYLMQGITKGYVPSCFQDWMYENRKAGDVTIAEDLTDRCFYIVEFIDRYRDETATANARLLVADTGAGQTYLDMYNNGEKTEDAFAALCDTYSADTGLIGGLYEQIDVSNLDDKFKDWFRGGRKYGDTTVISVEDGYDYVFFYIKEDKPLWYVGIQYNLQQQELNNRISSLTANMSIEYK